MSQRRARRPRAEQREPGYWKIAPQECPWCGMRCDTASNFADRSDQAPKQGDPIVCMKCQNVSVLGACDRDGYGRLHKPTAAELIELQTNPCWPSVEKTRRALQAFAMTRWPSSD